MSTWVTFGTGPAAVTAYNTYHAAVCAAQGLPRPGYRDSDGAIQILAQWTTAAVAPLYAGPTALSPLVALVPNADVATYGLTTTTAPNYAIGVTAYSTPIGLAIPATWTDPQTHIVYNTATGQVIG